MRETSSAKILIKCSYLKVKKSSHVLNVFSSRTKTMIYNIKIFSIRYILNIIAMQSSQYKSMFEKAAFTQS